MFPINSFEPERGLVVHLVVGIHVADVAVPDQVHVTSYLFLTLTNGSCLPRGVTFVNLQSDQIFTIANSTVQNWCQIDSN
jgi:hypothetical protein